ncbi:FecR domain-containing protein [Flavitalea sp. BT771]|uniref:FecR family protein n=1 Tax=Flavitalea sp. BT771 TaxID=3063329 RepID=UPI0026E12699|nr:FecR domain-containing protein [Flavitalea sp. BT771]MDO6432238.1 FecR domain-containing protein [Flavitalea sp. BT771]MDV6221148.1 FecR domain-containing protein [Flavitalea sp. BT771]
MNRNPDLYTAYGEELFAADEYFQQWVLHPDSDNTLFWESWLELNPSRQDIIKKARILVRELAANDYFIHPLSASEKADIKSELFRNLNLGSTPHLNEAIPLRRRTRWIPWAAAACLLAAIITAWLLFTTRPSANEASQEYAALTVTTGPSETKRVILEDSTSVILNAGSTLQFRNSSRDHDLREAWLTGNAYFKVKKDRKPFLIHARSLAIAILGTELNVNARSASIAVELTSGRIKVQQKDSNTAAYLLPGDRLQLDTISRTLVRTTIDAGLYTAWTEGNWSFRKTPLGDIAALLEEYYGVDVQFRSPGSRRLRIDALMPVSNLQDLVTVLQHTLPIKITLIQHQLIIN